MKRIFTAGPIAYETAKRLYFADKEQFEKRFPAFFLREFEKMSEDLLLKEAFLANFCIEKNTKKLYSRKNFYFDGSIYTREIADGGIFAALWAACEDLEKLSREEEKAETFGCSVELSKIPIEQHVVEILELVKESPYEVSSKGSWLVIADDLPEQPSEEGTSFTEIGKLTSSKDRLILSGDSKRFLSPPERQAKDLEDRRRGNQNR